MIENADLHVDLYKCIYKNQIRYQKTNCFQPGPGKLISVFAAVLCIYRYMPAHLPTDHCSQGRNIPYTSIDQIAENNTVHHVGSM